jgi:hypothetical protein
MSDQDTTDTTSPVGATTEQPGTQPAEGKAAPAVKLFTQDEVSRIAANARAEGRAEKQQATTQRETTKTAATPSNGNSITQADVQSLIARDRAFNRAVMTAQLTDGQARRMEAALAAENPADVAAWSATWIEDMGLMKQAPQQPATQNGTTVDPAKSGAAAPSAPSGSVNPANHGGVPDLWSLSVAQIDAMGPAGVRAEYEKIMAVGNARAGAPPRPRVAQRK